MSTQSGLQRAVTLASVVLLLLASAPTPVRADDTAVGLTLPVVAGGDIRFTVLTGDEGLASGNVYGIAQDKRGFLWFATGDGLSRYDGYSFRTYRFERGNPNSLASNTVQAILEGQGGVLWLGTTGGGVDRFDPATETFTHFKHDQNDPNSLSGNNIPPYGLVQDRQGALWVGTIDSGLNRLDPATGTFKHYRHDPKDANSLSSDSILSVYQDSGGIMWIGTSDAGLNRLDPVSGQITRYVANPDDPYALPSVRVDATYEDRAGTFWVGGDKGFGSLDRQTGRFTRYAVAPDRPDAANLNAVSRFYEDAAGNLWLGPGGGGILKFDRQQRQVVQYKHDAGDPHSLSNNFVNYFHEDPSGTMWVGTLGGGANAFSTRPPKFAVYRHEASNSNSVADNFILSVFEDHTGVVWIGNDRTLNRWDRQSNTWQVYRNDPNNPTSISNGSVTATVEDPDGTLWFGTFLGGLNRFDPKTGQFKAYRFNANDSHSLGDDIVRSLYRDSSGVLWVGGWNSGLSRFDRTTETFQRYLPDPADPTSLSAGSIDDIYEDSAKTLWFATEGGGLNRFDAATGKFTRFQNDPQNLASLPDDAVRVLYEDHSGQFWVGTAAGLCAFDRAKGTCTVYTTKEGLPNDTIEGILEDGQGNLWISTNNGLSRFNPKTKTFRNYDVLDGLQSNEFNVFTAFYKSPRTGEMYFGGINGFNVFDPSKVTDDPFVPPVVLTDFRLSGKSVPVGGASVLQANIDKTKSLTLNYDQNSLSFEFAALSYVAPNKNQYRYKLEGFDPDWRMVDSKQRLAVYTNLDPGTYAFRVQGTNEDGVWSDEGTAITVTINPPWWETWWLRIVLALALIVLAVAAYQYRVRSLRRRTLVLENQVVQRTHELEVAKDAAEAANRAKTAFLANMSHELRSPLTAMLGQTERVLRRRGLPTDVRSALAIVLRSGDHLRTLINQVLDLSKIEAGAAVMQEAPFDLTVLASELDETFGHLASAKGVRLRIDIAADVPRGLEGDGLKVRQVLINLLSNAIKFTSAGEVALAVTRAPVDEAATGQGAQAAEAVRVPPAAGSVPTKEGAAPERCSLLFSVRDTGPGIAEDELPKLFAAFSQADAGRRAREGTGLGLAISRTYVELMGGELQIQSKVGEGTTLTFGLPFAIAESFPRQTVDIPAPIALAPGQQAPRILVVDDDADSRETYVRFLMSIGVAVREAADGKEATELVAAESPDLVFMDILMPVMGGVEAARHIRSQGAPQPVIVAMTASIFLEEVPDILAAGCDDFLPKPFHLDKLVEMIEAHLGTRFVRVEPREQPTESELLAAAELPVGLRERLAVAVDSLEVEGIDAAIAEIRELDGVFGESLASYARDYRYGAILTLMRPPSADADVGAHG